MTVNQETTEEIKIFNNVKKINQISNTLHNELNNIFFIIV